MRKRNAEMQTHSPVAELFHWNKFGEDGSVGKVLAIQS